MQTGEQDENIVVLLYLGGRRRKLLENVKWKGQGKQGSRCKKKKDKEQIRSRAHDAEAIAGGNKRSQLRAETVGAMSDKHSSACFCQPAWLSRTLVSLRRAGETGRVGSEVW